MDKDVDDLERLLAGDKTAWDRFVARYAALVFAAVQRRLIPAGRGHDVDDVAQDVFLRLCEDNFRRLASYDSGQAKLSTWLTVVASRIAIDHLRRQKAPTSALDDVPESALKVEPVIPFKVKIPPDLLSARQALVIELLYRREMEVAEVAAALKIDPQTVRSTHHKALTKLRAHFQEENDTDPGMSQSAGAYHGTGKAKTHDR